LLLAALHLIALLLHLLRIPHALGRLGGLRVEFLVSLIVGVLPDGVLLGLIALPLRVL